MEDFEETRRAHRKNIYHCNNHYHSPLGHAIGGQDHGLVKGVLQHHRQHRQQSTGGIGNITHLTHWQRQGSVDWIQE